MLHWKYILQVIFRTSLTILLASQAEILDGFSDFLDLS